MKQFSAILAVCIILVVLGYGAYSVYYDGQSSAQFVPDEPQALQKETKEMILFMYPGATEESVESYLGEIKSLNKTYGYTPGGTPKGDIATMQSYAAAVEQLQVKYNIVSNANTATSTSRSNIQTTPSLAPTQVDTRYTPPAGPAGTGASTSSPSLKQNGTTVSVPAAPVLPSTEAGLKATTPPLIEQTVPPAPPLPPLMQE